MKAFILAAGFGTRLKPFTDHSPKALVPVNDIPLILYILAFLKHNKINEVVINLHHHGDKIAELLKTGKKLGMNIKYSREPIILGTGGGIKKALRDFKDDMLIINGDVIADFDLKGMIKQHRRNKPFATLAVYKHPESPKYGLLYSRKDQLASILKEPPNKGKFSAAMFGSFHILNKPLSAKALRGFSAKQKFCIMKDVYIPQIQSGKPFGSFPIKGLWTVNDSLADVHDTQKKLAKHKLSYKKILQTMQNNLS